MKKEHNTTEVHLKKTRLVPQSKENLIHYIKILEKLRIHLILIDVLKDMYSQQNTHS